MSEPLLERRPLNLDVFRVPGVRLLCMAVVATLCHRASAEDAPACVLTPSGKMLCCAANDFECVAKVQKAHANPSQAPTQTSPTMSTAPTRSGLLGTTRSFAGAAVWDRSIVPEFDIAVVGAAFGLESAYDAPGLQMLRREVSRLAPYSRTYGASLSEISLVDGQDLLARGEDATAELEAAVLPLFRTGRPVVALGGEQLITVPLLRAAKGIIGQFAVIHIDKDLATGTGSLEQQLSDDSAMFWGAATSLFDTRHSLHLGARGNLPAHAVELVDQELGFQTITADDVTIEGVTGVLARVKERLKRRDGTFMPAYISLDLDVLDPAFAPGTEVGGMSIRELRAILAGLQPFCRVVGADLRGVAPLSDAHHLRVAASVAHDLVLLAGRKIGQAVMPPPLHGSEL